MKKRAKPTTSRAAVDDKCSATGRGPNRCGPSFSGVACTRCFEMLELGQDGRSGGRWARGRAARRRGWRMKRRQSGHACADCATRAGVRPRRTAVPYDDAMDPARAISRAARRRAEHHRPRPLSTTASNGALRPRLARAADARHAARLDGCRRIVPVRGQCAADRAPRDRARLARLRRDRHAGDRHLLLSRVPGRPRAGARCPVRRRPRADRPARPRHGRQRRDALLGGAARPRSSPRQSRRIRRAALSGRNRRRSASLLWLDGPEEGRRRFAPTTRSRRSPHGCTRPTRCCAATALAGSPATGRSGWPA